MVKRFSHLLVLTSLFLAMSIVQPVQHVSAQSSSQPAPGAGELTSPEGFLNHDGTLRLDGSFSGALALSGWNVSIDPERGPVFAPSQNRQAVPFATVSPGNWSDMGGGGGGALNGDVYAVAVVGSDVYVGGYFKAADNIPEADYIAKWNGSNWSALGSDGAGGGSLNYIVNSLAIDGSGNVYY